MPNLAIIEDDLDFSRILKECLEEDDEVQVTAELGSEDEALSWLREGGLANTDCVLVDLLLPKTAGLHEVSSGRGLRLVQEMRQNHRFTGTILIITNSREFSDGQRALAAGCDGYLCKHAPMAEVPQMLAELRLALRGEIVAVSREMRHVFLREGLSIKEAQLMDMLNNGMTWAEIARELGYKTPKAAANIGYRAFDKLLTEKDRETLDGDGEYKRTKALERWRARLGQRAGSETPPQAEPSLNNK